MAPGQTHVHRFKFTLNRVISGEEQQNSCGNIKGLTIYTMMVICGVPCARDTIRPPMFQLQPAMERSIMLQERVTVSRLFWMIVCV